MSLHASPWTKACARALLSLPAAGKSTFEIGEIARIVGVSRVSASKWYQRNSPQDRREAIAADLGLNEAIPEHRKLISDFAWAAMRWAKREVGMLESDSSPKSTKKPSETD